MIDSSCKMAAKRPGDCFADSPAQQAYMKQKKQVKFRTCADVYEHWRSYKRSYKKAPKDGIEFQVDYIDTGYALTEEERAKAPIALALHGAPGSYHDYSLLIQHLSKLGVRVIAPNFPEYVATVRTKVLYRHSADEKAAYLRDFLHAINITKIDLLVSHSSAIFPTLLILLNANPEAVAAKKSAAAAMNDTEFEINCGLDTDAITADVTNQIEKKKSRPSKRSNNSCGSSGDDAIVRFEQPIEIKSVALYNPAGHRFPKSMKPVWFKCGSVHVYQHKWGRSFYRKMGPSFLTVVGAPVRVDNMDHVMLSATVMRNSKYKRVVKQCKQLSEMKIPTLLVFSENDKLIEREIFYEMTQFMGLNEAHFDMFDNDGRLELSQSRSDDWIRVMVFKAGGHYAYSNYAKTVNQATSELLFRVLAKEQQEKKEQQLSLVDEENNDVSDKYEQDSLSCSATIVCHRSGSSSTSSGASCSEYEDASGDACSSPETPRLNTAADKATVTC